MNLAIDIGNTHLLFGVFKDGKPILTFRKSSKAEFTSDELGVFMKAVLRERGVDPAGIKACAVSSVVPGLNYAAKNAVIKYFGAEPLFLTAGLRTGLNIKYKNPQEIGADRIANGIGAIALYGPGNMVIIDMGTATTFDIINAKKEYLGGLIVPGLKTAAQSLFAGTAKLPSIEISPSPGLKIGSTVEAMQSGIYHLNLCGIKGVVEKIRAEIFGGAEMKVIGTGGFSKVFEDGKIFDFVNQDLILRGLDRLIGLNGR